MPLHWRIPVAAGSVPQVGADTNVSWSRRNVSEVEEPNEDLRDDDDLPMAYKPAEQLQSQRSCWGS